MVGKICILILSVIVFFFTNISKLVEKIPYDLYFFKMLRCYLSFEFSNISHILLIIRFLMSENFVSHRYSNRDTYKIFSIGTLMKIYKIWYNFFNKFAALVILQRMIYRYYSYFQLKFESKSLQLDFIKLDRSNVAPNNLTLPKLHPILCIFRDLLDWPPFPYSRQFIHAFFVRFVCLRHPC